MIYPGARLLIFAKAPVAGRCKSRLAAGMTPARAAALYRNMLAATVARAVDSGLAPVSLVCHPNTRHPCFSRLQRRHPLTLRPQSAGDLGQRMQNALAAANRSAEYAVLVGTDCPALTGAYLERALEALASGADAVLGPASDGGYCLIGLRRADARLFRGVPWGTALVMAATRRRLRRLDLGWCELPSLDDIDHRRDYLAAKRAGYFRSGSAFPDTHAMRCV